MEGFWLTSYSGSSFDLGVGLLQDAYATWDINEFLTLTFGRFRAPTTRSMWVSTDQLVFLHRTALGEFGYQFNEGVMLSGDYESQFRWYASAQNGVDSLEDDLRWNLRGEYMLTEEGLLQEGAYTPTNDLAASFGVFVGDEGGVVTGTDGMYYGADVALNVEQFSFYGEVGSFDDGIATLAGDFYGLAYGAGDSATLWSATASYMLSPEEWEAAVRFEDFDDLADTTALSVGVNYYMQGHNAKWQLNWVNVSSDANPVEGSLIALGLTVGLEGYDA
jgi:hypothetical protein